MSSPSLFFFFSFLPSPPPSPFPALRSHRTASSGRASRGSPQPSAVLSQPARGRRSRSRPAAASAGSAPGFGAGRHGEAAPPRPGPPALSPPLRRRRRISYMQLAQVWGALQTRAAEGDPDTGRTCSHFGLRQTKSRGRLAAPQPARRQPSPLPRPPPPPPGLPAPHGPPLARPRLSARCRRRPTPN